MLAFTRQKPQVRSPLRRFKAGHSVVRRRRGINADLDEISHCAKSPYYPAIQQRLLREGYGTPS